MRSTTVQLGPDDRTAWARLQRARPNVDWHKSSMRRADFLGDGTLTRVMVGVDETGATFVGLVHTGREGANNPGIFPMPAAAGLGFDKIERQTDWLHEGRFPLAGCRPKRGKLLLRVFDRATEEHTLVYWHSPDRRFAAWSIATDQPPELWADQDLTG